MATTDSPHEGHAPDLDGNVGDAEGPFATGSLIDRLHALHRAHSAATSRQDRDQLESELREAAVSWVVLAAAADELGRGADNMNSLCARNREATPKSEPVPELVADVLAANASGQTLHTSRASKLRSLADQARQAGDYRTAASAFDKALRLSIPKRRTLARIEHAPATPRPIGGITAEAGQPEFDWRQIRKWFEGGEYRKGLRLLTHALTVREDMRAFAATRSALKEVGVSTQVLRQAADQLGWSKDRLHALEICRAEVHPDEGRAWWHWLQYRLPSLVGSENEPIAELLDRARDFVGKKSIDVKAIAGVLPHAPEAHLRSKIIKARAALAAGEERWGARLLTEIAERAPHVTVAHRQLGQIAFKAGDGLKAARHFEAAMLSPNMPDWQADQAEKSPFRMTTLNGKWDVYCCRGEVFVVPREKDSRGVTLQDNRLFAVRNTRGFRQWKRISHFVRSSVLGAKSSGFYVELRKVRGTYGPVAAVGRLLRSGVARLPVPARRGVLLIARGARWSGRRAHPATAGIARSLGALVVGARVQMLRYWIGAIPINSLPRPYVVADVFQSARRGAGNLSKR